MKSRDVTWPNISFGEWIKSKDNLKKTEGDLSDSKIEGDGSKEQKEPESPAKRKDTANNN
jgi:hypothetical protein